MNQTSDILVALDAVKVMLESIARRNGYNADPTLVRGWLQHCFQGRHQQEIVYPIVAYRPELSLPDGSKTHNANIIDTVTVSIDCAVSVRDAIQPVDDLLNLLKDVRRSLVFDPNAGKLGISEITFQECAFDVPESGDDYAFFSQKISIRVTEQYA